MFAEGAPVQAAGDEPRLRRRLVVPAHDRTSSDERDCPCADSAMFIRPAPGISTVARTSGVHLATRAMEMEAYT
jgi:hypothetical protein